MSMTDSLKKLRGLVAELYEMRYTGDDAVRIARAQGVADGYMRALSDLGIASDAELLSVVSGARERATTRSDSKFRPASSPRTVPHYA